MQKVRRVKEFAASGKGQLQMQSVVKALKLITVSINKPTKNTSNQPDIPTWIKLPDSLLTTGR